MHFEYGVKFLKKWILSLYVGIFAGANECICSKFVSFVVGFWHFPGPKWQRNAAFPKFVSFWVGFWAFLWPKVPKTCCIPKICVFLGRFWCFSGLKCQRIVAFPKFVSFCIQKCSNFMVWVSSLAGVITGNRCAKLCSLLLLKRCKICRKYTYFGAILRCVFHALSKAFVLGEGQKAHFTILDFM